MQQHSDSEEPISDMLREAFNLQENLQRDTYGKSPYAIHSMDERIQFIKDMNLALQDELHEFLGEIGWKPWATSRHVNYDSAQSELVDAFHFFMNLCMAVDMDADMLFERYKKKRLKNIKRQEAGYDGVDGKCPTCHRALDDDGVRCGRTETGWFCAGTVDRDALR